MTLYEYDHNNSGGRDWLSNKDWKALEAAGWELVVNPYGGWISGAKKEFPSLSMAIEEWESITRQDVTAEGCPCCGNPHTISGGGEYSEVNYEEQEDW